MRTWMIFSDGRAIRGRPAWQRSRVPILRTEPRSMLTTSACDRTQKHHLAIEEDGTLVGMIASFTVEGERELTYWIDPLRWGRGIASGAVQIFLRLETQRPLFARAAAHNLGSSKVLLRNGFLKIGEETSWAEGVGGNVLEHVYRLD
jgi:RimJ/RimL family protein N-acetyltransferase